MTINELLKKYSFHDSSIEKIEYCEKDELLTFTVDFCFWLQSDFVEGNKENGLIKLIFHNVKQYNNLSGDIDSFEILDAVETKGGVLLNVSDAFNRKYYEIAIESNDVDFVLCK